MMRLLVVFVATVALLAGTAFAQNGSIAVFSDAAGTDCFFTDSGGLVQVFVFHLFSPGATASEWMIYTPGWTHLGDNPDFTLVIGQSITGVAISYENCLQGDFRLMTINFFGNSASNCLLLGIVPAPNKAGVRAVDCAENNVFIPGGWGRINADGTCQNCDPPDPVEQSTWGQIKAMYTQ
jgi:hypothetical protein